MRWIGKNHEELSDQKNSRPFGVAQLIVGGAMLLCDLLLFLVCVHTSPSLVHTLWLVFVVLALAAAIPLLLGILLLWTGTHSHLLEGKSAQQDIREKVSIPKETQMYMSMTNRPGRVGYLEHFLLLFFFLAALNLVVAYLINPSLYVTKLFLSPSSTDPYPLPVTLFLGSILVFIAVVMVGVIQHWRWVFWLLLVAFGCSILELPATLLQLLGLLPGHSPIWYSLSQMGAALLEVSCAIWMFYIYRHYGVWAMGRKTHL